MKKPVSFSLTGFFIVYLSNRLSLSSGDGIKGRG